MIFVYRGKNILIDHLTIKKISELIFFFDKLGLGLSSNE